MKRRTLIGIASVALGLAPLSVAFGAHADDVPSPPSDPGPHGCVLSDPAAPVVRQSNTSTIGGSSCTYTQVGDGGFGGAAASWSISWCTPGPNVGDPCAPQEDIQGSGPVVGPFGLIHNGDVVTVSVTTGAMVAGTATGA